METVTRAVLKDAVRRKVGLPRRKAAQLVDDVIETICERLVAGKRVKISGLGSFAARGKGRRMGRNPKTREPAPIDARRVVAFRPSRVLKERLNERLTGAGKDG